MNLSGPKYMSCYGELLTQELRANPTTSLDFSYPQRPLLPRLIVTFSAKKLQNCFLIFSVFFKFYNEIGTCLTFCVCKYILLKCDVTHTMLGTPRLCLG